MSIRALVLTLACAVLLPGCVSWTDPAQLAGRGLDDLCSAYWLYSPNSGPDLFKYPERQSAIRTEIERRGAIAVTDWPSVESGKVTIGMSGCGVLAAWGPPTHVNNTATAAGTTSQLVYYDGGLPKNFVYLRNGVVIAVQN